MSKYKQTASLGKITDFTERLTPVSNDDLETRVSNLERALNEILLQLVSIMETLEPPHKGRDTDPQPRPQKQPSKQRPNPTPTPEPPQEPLSEEQVTAYADTIYETLLDGQPRPVKEICKIVACDRGGYKKIREHLINTERFQGGDGTELVAGKICNVNNGLAIWTQEQIDAEHQRRLEARHQKATEDAESV